MPRPHNSEKAQAARLRAVEQALDTTRERLGYVDRDAALLLRTHTLLLDTLDDLRRECTALRGRLDDPA